MEMFNIFKDYSKAQIKNPFATIYYMFTLCLSGFYFGFTLISISAVDFETIAAVYNIDFDISVAQGLFQGVTPIGGAIGAVSSAYFVSIFSRKQITLVFNAFAVVLCFLCLVPDYQIFFVVRFLQGFCCGLFSAVAPMILKQNSPHQLINITGTFTNLFIISGLFFLYFFSFILGFTTGDYSGLTYWKIILLFPVLTICIQSVLLHCYYPFQTPKYLAFHGRSEQLRQLLRQFYKEQYVQQQYDHVMAHHGQQTVTASKQELRSSDSSYYFPQQKQLEPKGHHVQSKCALLYGIFYALLCPMVGINVIMSYGGEVASKVVPSLKPIMPAILMFCFLVFAVVSIVYVDKYGRKLLTYNGTIGLVIILYLMGFGYFIASSFVVLAQIIIVFCLIAFLWIYGLTYAPVMWIYVSQVLQPHYLGWAVMINWVGASIVMIFFPIALEHLPNNNPGYVFIFFGTFGLLSLIVTSKLMIETKGKHEHEIAEEYKILDDQYFPSIAQKSNLEMNLLPSHKLK